MGLETVKNADFKRGIQNSRESTSFFIPTIFSEYNLFIVLKRSIAEYVHCIFF